VLGGGNGLPLFYFHNMISLDTETTGTDRWHGARPYLFTFCNEQFENVHYEFEVEPRTRRVVYNRPDLEEIAHSILSASILVLQNPKFDVSMVLAAMGDMDIVIEWPWHNTRDTLMAGHLLASNHAHDLASMAIEYLAVDIQAYEDVLKKAVSNCRNIVRCKDSPIGDWRIARAGLPEMPSAGGKMWKYDTWLPRAVAKRKIPEHERSWLTVASTYANSDSATTLALYKQQLELIRHRGLEAIYLQRLKLLPVVTDMESYGITANQKRLAELYQEYTTESQRANRLCCNIATSCNYELALPKSGTNKSLTTFVFDTLRLPVLKRGPKTGNPSMDKRVLEQYLDILPPNSKSLKFVGTLIDKRKRDTAISYMDGYKRFWLSTDHGMWGILHPNLNPTGSDTLRFSSNHPNEQNISKQEGFNLRYIFGPAPGREWWSLDAKNIELRIPAYEANEQELIDLFERGDEPPYYGSEHLLNFSTVYPDIWGKELEIVGFDKVGPHCKKKYASSWYQWCKNGGFAVGYGAVERPDGKGTADKAFHRAGSHALLKERFSKKEKLN
jgi:DNA polymerase I-like protein with 3'-5' exonuclease and polymerase domains